MIVGNKYECENIIGEGSYSQVRIATDNTTSKKVAIKLFKLSVEEAKEYLKEAEIQESLSHKNIIGILEYGLGVELKKDVRIQKVSFIATQLAEKGCLYDYIEASKGMSEQLAKPLFSQILGAMAYIHSEGISHRDIKAENILFNEKFEIKLCDFGFATRAIRDNAYGGSSYYMAPEVNMKKKYNGMATDIFSLGVLLYFMVIRNYPFVRATESDGRFKLLLEGKSKLFWRIAMRNRRNLANLSPEFIEFVTLCLSPNPLERPSISELMNHSWIKQNFDSKISTLSSEEIFSELSQLESNITDPMAQYIPFH